MAAQDQWRFCTKCGSLFYGDFGPGVCPAGGGHDKHGSFNYLLAYPPLPAADPAHTPQGHWRFCTKCGCLFHDGFGPGVCPAGAAHNSQGSYEYFLAHDVTPNDKLQDHWRFCTKCGCLFHDGFGPGVCPAGAAHDSQGSYMYLLAHGTKSPLPPPVQDQWRFCAKCFAMFFDGLDSKGRCPFGEGHDAQGYVFALPYDGPQTATTERNWRFCPDCYCMYFDGDPNSSGVCTSGNGHRAQGLNFVLPHNVPPTGSTQDQWRFCPKCYSMFYDGHPASSGVCPAGGEHDRYGFMFVLPLLMTPPARLQFRLRFFHEYASTDSLLQGGSDEVFIQGVGADSGVMVKGPGNTVDPRLTSSSFIGDASDNAVRNPWRIHPHVLLEFDLLAPAPWPRTFTSTLNIVEEDSEGLLQSFARMEASVRDEISEAITTSAIAAGALIGVAVGSSVPVLGTIAGAAIGAIGAAAYEVVIEEIKEGLGNEAFTPVARTLTIADLATIRRHPDIGRELSIRVTEQGADYEIFYDWNLVG